MTNEAIKIYYRLMLNKILYDIITTLHKPKYARLRFKNILHKQGQIISARWRETK